MTPTRQLAERIAGTRFEHLPAAVVAAAKAVCRDVVGVMLAGGVEESGVAERIKRHARSLAGVGPCSVVTGGFSTDALTAAFANGVLAHVLDYEPMMLPLTHPSSPVLPPLLALAEWEGHSGPAVLAALAVGFEAQALLRRVGRDMDLYRLHPPGVVGPLGAAAASANLMGLSPIETCRALGIAGSRACGLTANTGTMTKATHPANAGRMGLESALLARVGWTAHEDVLDGGRFAEFYFGPHDFSPLDRFGDPWFLTEPGVALKRYPSHTYTQRAIDAALEVRGRLGGAVGPVRTLVIETVNRNVVDRPHPRNGLEGKFSVQYTAVVALLDGRVGIDSFTDERRFSPDVERLLPRVRVSLREDIPDDILTTYTVVRAELDDGAVVGARCDTPRGYWGRPLTVDEQLAKFRDCAGRALAPRDVERLLDLLEGLDRLERLDGLMVLMRDAGHAA